MKRVICLICVCVLLLCTTGCQSEKKETASTSPTKFYVLSGPTGIGAAPMKKDSESKNKDSRVKVNIVSAPDEIVAALSAKQADIAAIPTNLAAKVYQKTKGQISVIAVNTLGVLKIMTPSGVNLTDFSDLAGKKIVATGQGANPEYILRHLLKEYGLENKVTVEFKAEGGELLTVWATQPEAILLAPEPVATTLTVKYKGSRKAIDLNDVWQKIHPDSPIMMGCIVARKEYLKQSKKEVSAFLDEYQKSVETANRDITETAELCEQYGIIPSAAIAKKAIPECHNCYITGTEMKSQLNEYYRILFEADPTAIGGKMPGEDYYYES